MPYLNFNLILNNLSDKNLLLVWEKGLHQPELYKALYLLELLYPDTDLETLMAFSIGERDANLLYLRQLFFGNWFYNSANCPSCSQKIEWEMPLEALQLQTIDSKIEHKTFEFTFEGKTIPFRLPNSRDMLDLSQKPDTSNATDFLLKKCMLPSSADHLKSESFSADLKNEIIEKMAELDPQADIQMDLICPECEHTWALNFDILKYLWAEIEDWAYRLLQDIGVLAMHFSWSEKDILELSSFRRNLYLKMLQS